MKKKYLIALGLLLILIGVVGLSYSFFSKGGKQELANTFKSGCLNIEIKEEGSAINLDKTYPMSDVDGLLQENNGYTFTIENTCESKTNYEINLESLDQQENTLGSEHVRVALSSDTMDNLIITLNEEESSKRTPSISGAYESYNLYTGIINGGETKKFKLKEWMEYETTNEEGLNKTYKSKINVITGTKIEAEETPEIKFTNNENTIEGTITGEVSNIKYCMTDKNECDPTSEINKEGNKITIDAKEKEGYQIVCTKINDNKTICSNPIKLKSLSEQTLAKLGVKSTTPLDATKLTGPSCDAEYCYSSTTVKSMQQNGVYEVKDQDGKSSYVYRGTLDNNWLKFGGYWWRIIRINGNGSLRVIYTGIIDGDTIPTATGPTTQIGTIAYNEKNDNNMYVGFKYSDGERQGNGTSSTILGNDTNPISGTLNKWYNDNIKNKDLEKYIEKDEIFCNDRRSSTSNTTEWTEPWNNDDATSGGTGTTPTYYGAYLRTRTLPNAWGTTQQATLTCENADQFSTKGAKVGNTALVNPIGLITADEVLLAGGFGAQVNNKFWLYTNSHYWTMSPGYFAFYFEYASVFYVDDNGILYCTYDGVDWTSTGVRPVINLKADTLKVGSGDSATVGTPSNAYTIGQ